MECMELYEIIPLFLLQRLSIPHLGMAPHKELNKLVHTVKVVSETHFLCIACILFCVGPCQVFCFMCQHC